MATVTVFTAARMKAIEDGTVVNAALSGNNLILYKYNGAAINVGNVRGPAGTNGTNGTNGATGPMGPQGPAGNPQNITVLPNSTDLNTVTASGMYHIASTPVNAAASVYALYEVWRLSDNNIFQFQYGTSSSRMWYRARAAGVWLAWREVAFESTLSKTVFGSLSGHVASPAPYGSYEKKDNGKLECEVRYMVNVSSGSFSSATWTFPVPFVGHLPMIQITPQSGATTDIGPRYDELSLTSVKAGMVRASSTNTAVCVRASGWWK